MPLSRIKQTSKTILIEEFCSSESAPDFYTMLRNEDVKQKSEFLSLIEKNLEVSSYEEFVSKFMPSVWEWYEVNDAPAADCPVRFCYSLKKPDNHPEAHEIELSKNEFYAMVMDLYSKKGKSGESNLEFDYSRVAELLSPKKVMENAKQLRKDLRYNYDKYLALGDGAKTEKNACIRKIKAIRSDIVKQYKDSLTGKIKLALADTEEKLKALPQVETEVNGVLTEGNVKGLPCKVSFDENGELDVEVIQVEDNHIALEDHSGDSKDGLALMIAQDFVQYGEEESGYIRDLVVSTYSGGGTSALQVIDRKELVQKRNHYTNIFKYSQEQFVRAISSAVEKMLDVKVFFEQSCIPGRKLAAPLIVTNCKATKLVEDEKVKEKFAYFIRESGVETDDYRIWFAIVPAIGDEEFLDNAVDLAEEDLFEMDLDFDEEGKDCVKTSDGDELIGIESVKILLEILREGKITTFFNYRANEKTGFGEFTSEMLEAYRRKLGSISGNPYAVFTYPNFTVLPKKETAIEIGKIGEDGQEKEEFLDIPGLYVDCAYVAAGLVVATQNPEYLMKKKFNIKRNNPCVRFNLEEGNNRFVLLTNMNREGKGIWASEVEDNIGRDMFGFCFCGNTKFYKGERVQNTYVYIARNMHKDKNGVYEPIYMQLTMDFVMQYLQTCNMSVGGGNRFKKSEILAFVDNEVGRWERESESEEETFDNSILHKNDKIVFEDDSLKVRFGGVETEIMLEIEREE